MGGRETRDVGAIANCCCCDSYFVYTIETVKPAHDFRGRNGKALLEELLLRKQVRVSLRRSRQKAAVSVSLMFELGT